MATESQSSDAKCHRAPAVTVAVAVAAGICLSRLVPGGFAAWWLAAAGCGVVWGIIQAQGWWRCATLPLLGGWLCLAAASHDLAWSWIGLRDISRIATDDGVSVRLTAKIVEPAWIVSSADDDSAPHWLPPERTLTTFECRELLVGAERILVAGRARLSLTGHYPELNCGDVISVIGNLRLPAEPLNPSDFDYRSWLKSQGIRVILHAESAACVERVGRESSWGDVWGRARHALRQQARGLCLSQLSPESAAVAETLLLGGRRRLDDELRQAFVDSGMMHVLAISGVNIALLGLWLTILCRLAGLTTRRSLLLAVGGLVMYAAVTDADPPVVRATAMGLVGAAAFWSGRGVGSVQIVAAVLLGMMLFRPTDLFDAGAQLSFLSVLTIGRTISLWQAGERRRRNSEPPVVPARQPPTWLAAGRKLWKECTLVSFGIWLATTPLVAWRFQLISPVGLVLNILLSPLIVVLMWAGYSFLILGMIAPIAAAPIAWLFDVCLLSLIHAVMWASSVSFGHFDIASPANWWMIGYYVGICGLLLWGHVALTRKLAFRGLLVWSALGLGYALLPAPSPGLSCRFLAVGHGLAALIELPNGKTLLYDAGSMANARRTARTIAAELRRRGRRRIDAVILSHADADHCNAMLHLIGEMPIGGVLIGPGFLNDGQTLSQEIVERCAAARIPVGLLSAGHRIALEDDVDIRILHPSEEFYSDEDNPFSLVAAVAYRGRTLLLTGDVEGNGLDELLRQHPRDCDVLLSPHHGSRAANPRPLADWSTPEWVVVSTREAEAERRLAERYGKDSRILATAHRGAVEFRIATDGCLTVESFRGGRVIEPLE